MKKYYYLYKITNIINEKIYYGIHGTNKLNDNYMGSGCALGRAKKKYGIENFVKEIIEFFDDEKSMLDAEAAIVTKEFVKDRGNYNSQLGGQTFIVKSTPNYTTEQRRAGQIKSWDNADKRLKQAKTIGDIAWKKWENLDDIKQRHSKSCSEGQRKSMIWENYETIKSIWISRGTPRYSAFRKIMVELGYPNQSYQRIIQSFIKSGSNYE